MTSPTIEQLKQNIIEARTRLATAIGPGDLLIKIKGQEHAKRVLTVAAVQGHTVGLYGPPGCGKSMLAEAGASLGVPVYEMRPCPCGYFTDPRKGCSCTTSRISQFWKTKQAAQIKNCDIHLEVPPVPANELLSTIHGTTLAMVRKRVDGAGVIPTQIDDFGLRLLKTAIGELGLSAEVVVTIRSVASSVAALVQSDIIRTEHIAEAIQYRRLERKML